MYIVTLTIGGQASSTSVENLETFIKNAYRFGYKLQSIVDSNGDDICKGVYLGTDGEACWHYVKEWI